MKAPGTFPFSAVVGNDDAKLALLLNAVEPRLGGVLLRGDKGSAKSTLARGLAELLSAGAPFVELPLSATEDRVVGSFDLKTALASGERHFEPGLLSAAHGGVLYVDEVNLLPDHLVDVLLDVAASGVNRLEREGLSHHHESRFVLVGSMNPEEGDLRPQLLDRFGLAVDVVSSLEPSERAEAVRRRIAFDADPVGFAATFDAAQASLRTALAGARPGRLDDGLLERVSALCVALGAEGLRADLVICRAAAALAGLEGRSHVAEGDIERVAPLALAHRRRRTPFEAPGVDRDEIARALHQDEEDGHRDDDGEGANEPDGGRDRPSERPQATPPGPAGPVIALSAPRVRLEDPVAGRRSSVEGGRGRLVGDRVPRGQPASVAFGATVRASVERRAGAGERAAVLEWSDVREAVREQKTANLVILVLDASASMGLEQRMEAVKGAVLGLLLDAYQRRDRVALVTFADEGAEVVLRPTGSVEVARARLVEVATGGRTPLASGISTALDLAQRARGPHRPLIVLVSDCRATWAEGEVDPLEAAMAAAEGVRRAGVPAVVVDVEDTAVRLGLAGELAVAMGGRYLALPELSAGNLIGAIKEAVGDGR